MDADPHIEVCEIDFSFDFFDDFEHFESHINNIFSLLGWLSVIHIADSENDVAVY